MASTPDRELRLVGNVELRIASAKTDSDLKANLDKFLCPLLLKLASPHLAVRNEVIKVCRFVDTCLAPTHFELPLKDLLTQFRDVEKDLVRLFDLRYIKVGLERLPESQRRDYFPQVLQGLHGVFSTSAKQASGLFSLFIRLLPYISLPPRASQEDLSLRDKFELTDDDTKFLSDWLGKLLLYQGPAGDQQPCLNEQDLEFFAFNDDSFWKAAGHPDGSVNLIESKILAAKFLSSGVFNDSERLVPAVIAAADTNSRISDTGNDMLKRCLAVCDLESTEFVDRLLTLYLGVPMETPPARPALKIRILNVLSKSAQAAKHRHAEKVIKDALDPETSGLEGSKLRTAAFAFVNWITRMSEGVIDTVPLIEETKVLIEGQGWPEPAKTGSVQGDAAVAEARGKAYETLGLLIRTKTHQSERIPDELKPVHLTKWLFRSLSEDTSGKEISLSIESAISNTLVAISTSKLVEVEEQILLEILQTFIHSTKSTEDRSRTAYPALRFVNQCFAFENCRARYLNVLALTTPAIRRELEEEAKGGLDPFIHSKTYRKSDASATIKLPDFQRLSTTLFQQHRESFIENKEAVGQAILFSKSVLFHQALAANDQTPVVDDRWVPNVNSVISNDEAAIKAIQSYLFSSSSESARQVSVELLALEAFNATVAAQSSPAVTEALLDLARFGPIAVLKSLTPRSQELKSVLMSSDISVRRNVARAYGILASQESIATGKINPFAQDLWKIMEKKDRAVGSELYRVQGALFALGNWLTRLNYRSQSESGQDKISSEELHAQLGQLKATCSEIMDKKPDKDLWEAVTHTLGELIRFNVDSIYIDFVLTKENSSMIDGLVDLAKKGQTSAVSLLGLLSFVHAQDAVEDSSIRVLTDKLYALHEEKKPELQFEVGAALSLVAFNRDSKALVGSVDVSGPSPSPPSREIAQQLVFDKVLEACKHTKPSLRQAGAIWLLCLLQYGGNTAFMQERLRPCQLAFKRLLGDKDTLNQESAASGLTLVFEHGDQTVKDQLVKDLVGSFISPEPTNMSGQVSTDTVLFDEGALPTGSGQSVTTYGDIAKLAREVGDDGLVYRFMNLAKNSSVWTSRAAFGRFGLSKVLSEASEDGYLSQNPKLYRALYRYRFDPNPNVQSAMGDIWSALVKDPSKIISQYFDDILADLLKHMTDGKEWRSRQASCAALADLIQGRPLEKYEQHLNDIWSQTFKLTDDQKGSVREEAAKLVRVLTTIVKRTLEAGESSIKNATLMLKQILPFLLGDQGVNSTVKEQQVYALKTITDLVKAGSAVPLRPFLPDMICGLLEQLSALEPEAANYIHLNADKYGITTQQLDDMRMTSVGRSPIMDAVERCIDHLDESSMKGLRPRLVETVKSGAIGLPSRVGVSRALISLATRRNFLFRQYAGEFLTLLRNKFVIDRNDTISTSAATACGYLARISSDKDILKASDWAQKQFFTSEDERRRVIAGEIVLAFGKYATDKFNSLANNLLPFVFLAKHDTFETSRELFKTTWEDNVSGSRVVLLHLKEILILCDAHLESPRWPIKHASAFAIAEAVTAAGKDVDEATSQLLWPSVERAMGGKTWEGKEKVLDAFVLLAKHSPLLEKDKAVADQMQKIVIREAKRSNAAYQEHSIAALGEFIEARRTVDWFEMAHGIVEPLLESTIETLNEKMDVDAKQTDAASSRVTALRTTANALKTLFAAIDPVHHKGGELKSDLEHTLTSVKRAMTEKDRSINEAIFDGMKQLFERLHKEEGALHDANLVDFASVLFGHEDYPEQTRLKAAEAAGALAKLAKNRLELRSVLKEKVAASQAADRSKSVKDEWLKAVAELEE